MGTNIKDTYGALGKADYVFMDPVDVLIVGVDVPEPTDPNHPLFKLRDPNPERAGQPVDDMIALLSKFGWLRSSAVTIRKVGDRVYTSDGRRRTRAARAVNAKLLKAGSDALIRMTCIPDATQDSTITAVCLNRGRLEDSPLGRARIIERLISMNYDDESIMAALGGIGRQTFDNLKALLNLTPEIRAEIESGKLAPTMGYELGKFAPEKQPAALAKVRAETGSEKVTGAKGRERIKAAATGRQVATTTVWKPAQIKALYAILEPSEAEPHEDQIQQFAYLLLGVLTGEDKRGSEALSEFPSVAKLVAKFAPSAKVEK